MFTLVRWNPTYKLFALNPAETEFPGHRIVMTLLVRNEDDILLENILFHYSQGISRFIVMDNLSTDSTQHVIEELSHSIPIEYIIQDNDDYDQSAWVTQMAKLAFDKYSADWVINNDADEFWVFPGFDAITYVKSFSAEISSIILERHNAVLLDEKLYPHSSAHPTSTILFEKTSLNSTGSPLPGKCMHRASDNVVVHQGNHSVSNIIGECLRRDDAFILHFPYRNFEKYCLKISLGGAAYERNSKLSKQVGITWRHHFKLLQSNGLTNFWKQLHLSPQQCIIKESEGLIFTFDLLSSRLALLLSQWRSDLSKKASLILLKDTEDAFNQYLNRILNPVNLNQGGSKSLPYNNLPFLIEGPKSHLNSVKQLTLVAKEPTALLSSFNDLRNIYSLFPANKSFLKYLSELLFYSNPSQFRSLRADCGSSTLILNLSCQKYLQDALESSSSFSNHGYKTIIVVGDNSASGAGLSFDYSNRLLKLPVSDSYENLGEKLFMALLVLELTCDLQCVVKIDDDLMLDNDDRFFALLENFLNNGFQYSGRVLKVSHSNQCHGWHLGKCSNLELHSKGYQYPMPGAYASGGFGYLLGSQMINACASMFLSMPSFFEMSSVQLEDVFVGHAAAEANINCITCFDDITDMSFPDCLTAVLPGLKRQPDN